MVPVRLIDSCHGETDDRVDDTSACDGGTRPKTDSNGVRLVSQVDGLAVGGVGRDRLATAVDARERVDATRRAAPEGDRAETAED